MVRETVSEKLKRKLKTLAKRFSLKYNSRILNLNIVSKKELVMINYLNNCPDYNKFGRGNERVKNIEKFLSSKLFMKSIKKQGGCVINKKDFINKVKNIRNLNIRKKYEKIIKKMKGKNLVVYVSKPTNIKERKFVETIILHEWIHILLNYNKINLQKINPKFWILEDGLVNFIQHHKGLKND